MRNTLHHPQRTCASRCAPPAFPKTRSRDGTYIIAETFSTRSLPRHNFSLHLRCLPKENPPFTIPVMPPSHLPRVEELEFWSTGEKARSKHHSAKDAQDTVTISTELYERLLHATKHSAPDASVTGSKRANAGPFGLFGYESLVESADG